MLMRRNRELPFLLCTAFIFLLLVDTSESVKTSWPELVNWCGGKAMEVIRRERPDLQVSLLRDNQPATLDYRTDRVRIIIDSTTGVVKRTPRTG